MEVVLDPHRWIERGARKEVTQVDEPDHVIAGAVVHGHARVAVLQGELGDRAHVGGLLDHRDRGRGDHDRVRIAAPEVERARSDLPACGSSEPPIEASSTICWISSLESRASVNVVRSPNKRSTTLDAPVRNATSGRATQARVRSGPPASSA
jgi:hypothetical protein